MNIISIIEKKKDAKELSPCEVEFFVKGITDNTVTDMQAAAFLMAVCINGMTDKECAILTQSMAKSGEMVDLSKIVGNTVDKHSSGGVGDSTTFIILPVLAALGYKCAKMSGRGLGHTGGTLDKLESIKGMKVELLPQDFFNQVNQLGLAIIGQSKNICPADKKLYAIRDVTSTVNSIPLIASSIMSKKIAGGADNIVLDVKCGSGAFIKDEQRAIELANVMVAIAKPLGRKISAVITRMDEPLDRYIGNSLEILGALKALAGEKNRLLNVSKQLVISLLQNYGINPQKTSEDFDKVIEDGSAKELFYKMITAQGGDCSMLNAEGLLTAKYSKDITAKKQGYVKATDCEGIGKFASELGAGRKKIEDTIEHNVGIEIKIKIGDYVRLGQVIATVYYNREELHDYIKCFESLITYSEQEVIPKPDIIGIIR